ADLMAEHRDRAGVERDEQRHAGNQADPGVQRQEAAYGRALHACTPIQPSSLSPYSRPKQTTVAPPNHSHARKAFLNTKASTITAIHIGKAIITAGSAVISWLPGQASASKPIRPTLSGRPSIAAARYLAHIPVLPLQLAP